MSNQVALIRRLTDRVAELEDVIGIGTDDVDLIKLATGLQPAKCRILGMLRKNRGIVSTWVLFDALYGGRPECDQPKSGKTIHVAVSGLRADLRLLNIGVNVTTVHGMGYQMDEPSRVKLGELMQAQLAKIQPAERA
ncbi:MULTISPECIES: helix-turn-helix domain-containing protein [unclassified Bradyrhizobium]|uniref:helix-turn-helix domain-containing protein n=1 Tax=unclassified Bradyrhizobium TaxID=2631580 RepID=UPI0028EF6EB5|nr:MULTISPECIES: helix-turn-helix domain-containing protein [unclassified Bradyrhizobium]